MIAVPIPLPCQKPCKTSCSTMELQIQLFTINVQTYQYISSRCMPLYSLPPFGIRTIVVHIKAYGMFPSQNSTCVTLTTFYHNPVSGSFSLVAACNNSLRCSAFIPDCSTSLPNWSLLIAVVFPPTSGGPSAILTGCTRIGSGSPFGGRFL